METFRDTSNNPPEWQVRSVGVPGPKDLPVGSGQTQHKYSHVASWAEMGWKPRQLRLQVQDLFSQHRELLFTRRASVSPQRHLVCSSGRLGFCLLFKPKHAEVLHTGRNIIRRRVIWL